MSILFYGFAKMAVLITHMIVNNLIIILFCKQEDNQGSETL